MIAFTIILKGSVENFQYGLLFCRSVEPIKDNQGQGQGPFQEDWFIQYNLYMHFLNGRRFILIQMKVYYCSKKNKTISCYNIYLFEKLVPVLSSRTCSIRFHNYAHYNIKSFIKFYV